MVVASGVSIFFASDASSASAFVEIDEKTSVEAVDALTDLGEEDDEVFAFSFLSCVSVGAARGESAFTKVVDASAEGSTLGEAGADVFATVSLVSSDVVAV